MKIKKISYFHYFLTAFTLGLALSVYRAYQNRPADYKADTALLILTLFAAGVVVICALGLMGNLLTAIQQNRRTIGVHLAVGADTGDIFRLVLLDTVLKRAALPVLLGGIGSQLLAASPISRLLNLPLSAGFGNTALCILASLGFLLFCALYPAAAAAQIQPAEVWKEEGI